MSYDTSSEMCGIVLEKMVKELFNTEITFRRLSYSFDTPDIGFSRNLILDLSFMLHFFAQPLDVGECPLLV